MAAVETELRSVIAELEGRAENIVMMSSGNVGGASAFSKEQRAEYEAITRSFRAMFMKVAEETPVTYVDLFREPEDDAFIKEPKKYLAIDGLHPSSEGYALWYRSLKSVLREILGE